MGVYLDTSFFGEICTWAIFPEAENQHIDFPVDEITSEVVFFLLTEN